ncbi:uridine kinase [Pycnococcus provasolii]
MTTVDTIRPADHQPSEIPPAVGVGYVATNGGTTVHHDGLHRRTSSNGSIPHAHAALTHEPRATPTKFAANGGGSSLLKNWLQIRQNPDGRYDLEPICDELSFEKGFFLFVRAIQQLKAVTDETIIVGLAGPSGAGKTVFSQKVCDFIDGVAVLSMDMYNDGTRVVDDNFDDPRLTDYDLLMENLTKLRAGYECEAPIYDFKTSTRVGYRKVPVPPSKVVVVEGIYALSDRLRPLLDLRVSITGGVHFDLVKRVMRDVSRSGQQPQAIIQQISETVYPMYKAFIEPDLQTAHLRIVNTFNPFSGFQDPVFILKSDRVENITNERIAALFGGPDRYVKEHVETHDIYLLPPGEDPETCNTWLRMRNREGIYSLMFEEWLTDDPFVISPRISFDVSVRVLGGLMALGYEIGSIVRRSSTHYRHLPEMKKSGSSNSTLTSPMPSPKKGASPYSGTRSGSTDADNAGPPAPPAPASPDDVAEESFDKRFGTSSGWSSDSQFAVKVDHFAGLERAYVNIQGRNRDEVAAAGRILGLDNSYIAQSYIELLQLESLTKEMNSETAYLRESYMQQIAMQGGSATPPAATFGSPIEKRDASNAAPPAHVAGEEISTAPRRKAALISTPSKPLVKTPSKTMVNGGHTGSALNLNAMNFGGNKSEGNLAYMRGKTVADALERAASAAEAQVEALENISKSMAAAAESMASARQRSHTMQSDNASVTTTSTMAVTAALAGVALGAWLARR